MAFDTSTVFNLGFTGLALAFALLLVYVGKARKLWHRFESETLMRKYYRSLIAVALGGMFSFIGFFTYTWTVRLVPDPFDWMRLAVDVFQIGFIILSTYVGRNLVKHMIRIQKEHGL